LFVQFLDVCLYNFCLYDFAHHITTKVVGSATARRRATRLYLFALGSIDHGTAL
jgi:hypothetical protein